jgi:hypothetical protein
MNFKTQTILIMLTLLGVGISFGQNLEKHQWKHRVLLILSNDSTELNKQINLLKKDISELTERKLIVYKVNPLMYQKGIESTSWISSKTLYSEYKKKDTKLEIILIGLDGGVKLRQTELLSTDKLFTLIDGMPMRRQELKN